MASWWQGIDAERYWVEITDRDVIGDDLWAPQLAENGKPNWTYTMVTWVQEGDVVLHYRTGAQAFTAWSRCSGPAIETEIEWGSHGYVGGRGPVQAYERSAWLLPLDGPYPLSPEIPMAALRKHEARIGEIQGRLKDKYGSPLYFPFQLSNSRPMRAQQAYMTKMPRVLLESLPELVPVLHQAEATQPTAPKPAPSLPNGGLGADYRQANEEPASDPGDPHAVDPNLVDRALAAHARTQNALAALIREKGLVPLSPAPGEPSFDLAWVDGDAFVVAEVKSLTNTNEEKQLRLGLGQVLRYGHQLSEGRIVKRLLVTEREPQDGSWLDLCSALGVDLVWAPTFEVLANRPPS